MALIESIRILESESTTKIYFVHHIPAGIVKAVVVLVHGLGEHIRRYDEQLFYFNERGVAVMGADLIGHGRTEGQRGSWISMESNYKIIKELITLAHEEYPNLPVYLYGHSMGGNIAARYCVLKNPSIQGLILTGPAIKTPKDLPYFMVKGVLAAPAWIKNIRISNGLNLKSLCSVEAVVSQYLSDPLVHNRISLGAGATIFENAYSLLNDSWTPPYPVLLMHGAQDQITLPAGTESLKNHWGTGAELKIWTGMLHEIHNEKEKLKVWQSMLDWLERIPPSSG
jgi:alpha-beta hydrolase superfamily lysophospholipase